MNIKQLERGKELLTLIGTTEKAISQMESLREKFYESSYCLLISEQRDGSGFQADLRRKEGNEELLEVIISTLLEQLNNFNTEFEAL